jgi:hypothetical protein
MGAGESKPELNEEQLKILKTYNNLDIYKIMKKSGKFSEEELKESLDSAFLNYKQEAINEYKKNLDKNLTSEEIEQNVDAYNDLLELSRTDKIKNGFPGINFVEYLNDRGNPEGKIYVAKEMYSRMLEMNRTLFSDPTIDEFAKKYKTTFEPVMERIEVLKSLLVGYIGNPPEIWTDKLIERLSDCIVTIGLEINSDKNTLEKIINAVNINPNLASEASGTTQSGGKKAAYAFITLFIAGSITATILVNKLQNSPTPAGPTTTIKPVTPSGPGVPTTTIKPVTPPTPSVISIVEANTIIAISALLANKISGCYLITNNGGNIITMRLEGCSDWYSGSDNQMFCSCPTGTIKQDCSNTDLSKYPFCIDSSNNPDAKKCIVKDPVLKGTKLEKCNGTSIDQDGFVFYQYQYYPPTSVINTINNITQQLGSDDDKKKGIVIIILIVLIIIAIISIVLYIMLNRSVKKIKRSSRSNR